jgi:ATP-binding cassette, subfamily B, bacterial PglK
MKTLLEIWRLLRPPQRRRLLVLCVVALAMAVSTLCGITAVLPFLAALGDTLSGSRTGVLTPLHAYLGFESDGAFVAALGLAFVALVTAANAINLAGSLLMTRFAHAVGSDFQVAVFDEYLRRDCHFHSRHNSATLASKVVHDAGRVTTGLLHGALTLLTGLMTSVLIVASLVVLNPLVAVLAVATLGASYLLIYAATRDRLLRNGRVESRHAAERTRVVNEAFGGIREVLLLDGRRHFVARFREACDALARTLMSTLAISQAPRYLLECLAAATLVGIAILLAGHASGGGAWMAQLTFVGFAAYRLLPALQSVYSASVRITADSAAFDAMAEELRAARARTSRDDASPIDRSWAGRPRHDIALEAVNFRYAPDQPYALRDVSLRIPAGATVGLVGPNGAGKTTLVDVLTGLLTPESGRVLVDGTVLDDGNRRAWRSALAYVPQNVFILDATVAGNIALGVPADEIDQAALHNAIRMARLEDCIAGLPNGLDETLGERGVRLSGGQRQRIGLARALYRNATVLILDEGTSALDAQAELDVIETLTTFRRQKTVIVISHRDTLLQHCEQVVELEQGRITGRRAPVEAPLKYSLNR